MSAGKPYRVEGRERLPQRMIQTQLFRRVDLGEGHAVFSEVTERGFGWRMVLTAKDLPVLESIIDHLKRARLLDGAGR